MWIHSDSQLFIVHISGVALSFSYFIYSSIEHMSFVLKSTLIYVAQFFRKVGSVYFWGAGNLSVTLMLSYGYPGIFMCVLHKMLCTKIKYKPLVLQNMERDSRDRELCLRNILLCVWSVCGVTCQESMVKGVNFVATIDFSQTSRQAMF